MATERNMIGFELGVTDEFTTFQAGCSLVQDLTGITPRSGLWFLRMAPAAQQYQVVPSVDGVVLSGSYAGSGHLRVHCRFFMRINTLPLAQIQLFALGTVCNLFLASSGQCSINFTGSAAVNGPTLSADGAWHQIDLDFDMDGGTPANSTWSLQVDGGSLTTNTHVNAGPFGVGGPFFGLNSTATFSIDIDDYIMFSANLTDAASSLTMPTRTHILPAPIVAQGGTNQWTSNFTAVQDVPPSTSPDTFQSSASAGQKVTWQKDLHQWNDISGTVQGIKMYAYVRHSGSGSASVQPLINGVVVNTITNYPLIPAGYPTGARIRAGFDWTEYALAAYDSLELGLLQNGTLQANAGGIFAEVLSDVSASPTVVFKTISPSVGPTTGGQLVTFTGTFSRRAAGIAFDTSVFIVTSISVTQIVGTTTAHQAGIVDILCNSSVVMPKAYTYASGIQNTTFQLPSVVRFNPGHSIERRLDNTPGQFKFNSTPNIVAGTPLQINGAASLPLINGVAVRSTRVVEGTKAHAVSQVECTDRQYYMNRRLVFGSWVNIAADVVITQIIQTFAPDFSSGGVQAGMPNVTVQFAREVNVSDAISKVMQGIGGHWYLDLSGIVHAYIGVPPGVASPDVIDDNNQGIQFEPALQMTTDLSQIRNRVYVRGRGSSTSIGLESPFYSAWFNGNAPLFDFTLAPPGAGSNNGITVAAYFGWFPWYGGYYTGAGGAHGTFLYASNSRITNNFAFTIFINPSDPAHAYQGNMPGYGTTILENIHGLISIVNPHDPRITGFTLFRKRQVFDEISWYLVGTIAINALTGPNQYTFTDNVDEASLIAGGIINPSPEGSGDTSTTIYVMREDKAAQSALAAIEGGDGIHEYQINDPSIQTTTDANSRGDAELALFANPIVTLDYYTRDQKSLPGAIVHFNLSTNPPIVGDFEIQQVTIDQVKSYHRGGSELVERYHVVASSVRFTLDDLFRRVLLTDTPSSASTSGNVASVINTPPQTPAAADVAHYGETPSGTIDGVNKIFSTALAYATGKLSVYRNGVRQQKPGDYSETSSTSFTFVIAPNVGDTLLVDYATA